MIVISVTCLLGHGYNLSTLQLCGIKKGTEMSLTLCIGLEFDTKFETLPLNRKPKHHETHILLHRVYG